VKELEAVVAVTAKDNKLTVEDAIIRLFPKQRKKLQQHKAS
jgi:hypothetical protein